MEKLRAEDVLKLMHKEGRSVSLDQASEVLEFLRKMAMIVIEKHLEEGASPRQQDVSTVVIDIS